MSVEGILLSQTVYKKNTISDWHFHEHPYFALILNGGSTEVRKTNSLECLPGHAYFYNWEDVHRNKDYQEGSRNFNIEFDKSWLSGFNLQGGVCYENLCATDISIHNCCSNTYCDSLGSWLLQLPSPKRSTILIFASFNMIFIYAYLLYRCISIPLSTVSGRSQDFFGIKQDLQDVVDAMMKQVLNDLGSNVIQKRNR